MTEVGLEPGVVWLLAVVLGIGTFGLRLSFIHFQGWLAAVPPRVERGLEFVPAAILAALVCSELFSLEGAVLGMLADARVPAAGVAVVVAWWTENMMATIAVGMAALWTIQFVAG